MSAVDINCRMGSYGDYTEGNRTGRARSRRVAGADGVRRDEAVPAAARGNVPENSTLSTFGQNVADARAAADGETADSMGKAVGAATADSMGKAAGAETADSTGKTAESTAFRTEAKSPGEMSLAEYVQYINGKISELSRRSYGRHRDVFIYISEEGYRAMQNDPEYEEWVMQNIRDAYRYSVSWCGHDADYHSVHLFGATKEDYRGQSWSSGCRKCEDKRRQELKLKRKKQLKAYLKKQQERKRLEKLRLEKLHVEKEVYKKLLTKRRLDRERLEEEQREEALARREAASAFRMYMAALMYSEQ